MAKATTIRFTDEVFARLDQASSWTGMPVNSIVVAACLEWMERHTPGPLRVVDTSSLVARAPRPRWSTIRRAVELTVGKGQATRSYPFGRFTATAQELLTSAQAEADRSGANYIGTEHLLLGVFAIDHSEAARVLQALGVKQVDVRSSLQKLLHGPRRVGVKRIVPTARVKSAIELAFDASETAGKDRVSTAHVLLGLSREGEGMAAVVLNDLGATRNRIASAIDELTETEA